VTRGRFSPATTYWTTATGGNRRLLTGDGDSRAAPFCCWRTVLMRFSRLQVPGWGQICAQHATVPAASRRRQPSAEHHYQQRDACAPARQDPCRLQTAFSAVACCAATR
jgi:hypothetical protein